MFGDFNFRCDTEGVVKKLTKDLSIHRIMNIKNDHTKLQYRDDLGSNVLTIGKKEFSHVEHQTKFKESWVCTRQKINFFNIRPKLMNKLLCSCSNLTGN